LASVTVINETLSEKIKGAMAMTAPKISTLYITTRLQSIRRDGW
jgi:hypothetical protein